MIVNGHVVRGFHSAPIKEKKLLNAFQGVALSSTAFIDLDVGYRYHSLYLVYGGTTFDVSHMTNIRIIANGETIWNLSGTRQDVLNQYENMAAASTYKALLISFEREGLNDEVRKYTTCINTGIPCSQAPRGITKFRIEVDIDSGAVAPTLVAYAKVSINNPHQGIWLPRRKTFFENVPGSATVEFLLANKFNGNGNEPGLARLTFAETAANLTNIRLSANGQDVVNLATAANQVATAQAAIRKVNTSYVMYDTAEDGNYNAYFRANNLAAFDARIIDSNANAALPVIVETLGTLNS
jgi:hypothetical protein